MTAHPITGAQCAAARALTQVGVETLARRSGVDAATISRFESGVALVDAAALAAIQTALEAFGAHFLPESDMGAGVRLRFSSGTSRRLATWENEGGPAAEDDVPG